MSIENGERFIRALQADQALRDKIKAEGRDRFHRHQCRGGRILRCV